MELLTQVLNASTHYGDCCAAHTAKHTRRERNLTARLQTTRQAANDTFVLDSSTVLSLKDLSCNWLPP
eukprot:2210487-Amphidinium_carterae.1